MSILSYVLLNIYSLVGWSHHISSKGIWSEKNNQSRSTLNVPHLQNSNNECLYVDNVGTVTTKSIANLVRSEFYEEHGAQLFSGSYVQISINGSDDLIDDGLNTWNTASSVFQPKELGDVYTIRFSGQIEPRGGNPILHMDFTLSGTVSGEEIVANSFRHHQSVEQLVRNTDHVHIHAVYTVYTDADLLASGGIIVARSTGEQITMLTSSVMIKEG